MALLSSCICCSLLSAAIMSGVISSFLYSIAFALEIWWILEAEVSLSIPAYILACGYILMTCLSLLMLFGLRTKRTRFLLSWVLLMILYIFPEAGLVLFMAIYHWHGKTYGIIELSLWALRVVFNVFGIVSVQSLWSNWRDEKSVFRSLRELSVTAGGVVTSGLAENGLGIPGHHKLRGSLRGVIDDSYQTSGPYKKRGYNNPAFSNSSTALINGNLAITKYTSPDSNSLKRSSSGASGFVSASRVSLPQSLISQSVGRNEFNPGYFHRSQSEFELPSFGLDPDAPVFLQGNFGPGGLPVNIYRGNSRADKIMSERMEWYRPRSLGNLTVDLDNISIWSEKYRGIEDNISGGFDRQYRAASLGNLNLGYLSSSSWAEGLERGHSKQSLGQMSGVSDNPERYGDIAL